MDDEEYKRRQGLTFSEAEGLAPLPTQLQLGEISPAIKAELWAIFHGQIERSTRDYGRHIAEPLLAIAKNHWVRSQERMIDEFNSRTVSVTENWKAYFHRAHRYDVCLGFVQWMLKAFNSEPLSQAVARVSRKTCSLSCRQRQHHNAGGVTRRGTSYYSRPKDC
jgi:hypothetical protein